MRTLFITGTDTEIGKTHVSVALIRHLVSRGHSVAGLKPVASGCAVTPEGLRNEDAIALMGAANVQLPYEQVNPCAFERPIAPHIAAKQAGRTIDPARLAQSARGIEADWLVVEGVGGWCVPLNDEQLLAELAAEYTREVALVVGLRLGCINHALLTADRIIKDGFDLVGWVANQLSPEMEVASENLATLDRLMPVPRLGWVPFNPRNVSALLAQWSDLLDSNTKTKKLV